MTTRPSAAMMKRHADPAVQLRPHGQRRAPSSADPGRQRGVLWDHCRGRGQRGLQQSGLRRLWDGLQPFSKLLDRHPHSRWIVKVIRNTLEIMVLSSSLFLACGRLSGNQANLKGAVSGERRR